MFFPAFLLYRFYFYIFVIKRCDMPKLAKQILDIIGNTRLMELSAYSLKYGLFFCILTIVGTLNANGQSYYDLSEKGVSCFEKDSLEQAENYFRQALKLDQQMLIMHFCFLI